MLVPFRNPQKVDNLTKYLEQVTKMSDIDEYERMIKRLKDRGKISSADAKQLNNTLKIRRAILKR